MRKIEISAKALADVFGCTVAYINQLSDKAICVRVKYGTYDFLQSAQNYIKLLRKKEASKPVESPDPSDPSQITIEEAKRLKAIKEVEKLELQNARERGDLIPKDKVRDRCIKAGSILVAELNAIENDLPGQIEGAKATLIRERLSSRFTVMLERFREQLKNAEEIKETEE